jgi:metallo-beta-lactamase family protein
MGTTGRRIVEGEKRVKIFRENVSVAAKIFTIGGFSAHADQKDLLDWVAHFEEARPKVFVVHGEQTASETLAREIGKRFSMETRVPMWKERLILKPREVVREAPEEAVSNADFRQEMLNSVIDLEKTMDLLKRRLNKIEADRIGEEDVDNLKYIREELETILDA